ncbi:O-methyltransferase [Paenibacillus sp. MMS20-IR301]|uniref:O-methyltransferase n=1 Tax=Paenibacillus sp. MMS20-IR301 TaxID=2895946 RepID=UPI0028EC8095|nr:O-methyltransferase [Paenibacillus sp. MMS20-IR301]WNS43700.1 O-methyltransferase [Paenibacillus sp. MMS20-IR301]
MEQTTTWSKVDLYINGKLLADDPVLDAVLDANSGAGLPQIDVAPNQGKLIYLLAKMNGAANILEIGTLGGYSTIWLARALPETGKLVSLELEHDYAVVAEDNLRMAGLADKVVVLEGPALESLASLASQGREAFDFIFIDADKPNNPQYLEWALKLARPGTVIVADNVVRGGEVIEAGSQDARVQGIRQFMELLAAEPRIEATAIQTVGSKGYDGFMLGIVTA